MSRGSCEPSVRRRFFTHISAYGAWRETVVHLVAFGAFANTSDPGTCVATCFDFFLSAEPVSVCVEAELFSINQNIRARASGKSIEAAFIQSYARSHSMGCQLTVEPPDSCFTADVRQGEMTGVLKGKKCEGVRVRAVRVCLETRPASRGWLMMTTAISWKMRSFCRRMNE